MLHPPPRRPHFLENFTLIQLCCSYIAYNIYLNIHPHTTTWYSIKDSIFIPLPTLPTCQANSSAKHTRSKPPHTHHHIIKHPPSSRHCHIRPGMTLRNTSVPTRSHDKNKKFGFHRILVYLPVPSPLLGCDVVAYRTRVKHVAELNTRKKPHASLLRHGTSIFVIFHSL